MNARGRSTSSTQWSETAERVCRAASVSDSRSRALCYVRRSRRGGTERRAFGSGCDAERPLAQRMIQSWRNAASTSLAEHGNPSRAASAARSEAAAA